MGCQDRRPTLAFVLSRKGSGTKSESLVFPPIDGAAGGGALLRHFVFLSLFLVFYIWQSFDTAPWQPLCDPWHMLKIQKVPHWPPKVGGPYPSAVSSL